MEKFNMEKVFLFFLLFFSPAFPKKSCLLTYFCTHILVYIHPPQSHEYQKSQRKSPQANVTPGVTPRTVTQAIPVCFAEGHGDQRVIFKGSHQVWRDFLGVLGDAANPCWKLDVLSCSRTSFSQALVQHFRAFLR